MYNKHITLTLFCCLIITICFFVIKWLYDIFKKHTETFYNKRNTRAKFFKSNEILDPDENPDIDDTDPDDRPGLNDLD